MYELFLTCAKGLEQVSADELANLGVSNPKIETGGVSFKGELADIYRINLWSRVGIRLLQNVFEFPIRHSDDIYHNLSDVSWKKYFDNKSTFAVSSFVRDSVVKNSSYTSLVVKDAIVDYFRKHSFKRPSVDKKEADIRLNVYITNNYCKVYIDSTVTPLYKRGYRQELHEASLNEALAAGIIYLSGWDKSSNFFDPLCGSGTFAVEAALMALNIAPGIQRNNFGFMKWNNFDKQLWNQILKDANDSIKSSLNFRILASDIDGKAIQLASGNAARSRVGKHIQFQMRKFQLFRPNTKVGTIICNPPYGIRIGQDTELELLHKQLGDMFKNFAKGMNAFIFTGNLELLKSVGLKSTIKIPLYNGRIDSRLVKYEMY